MRDFTDLYIPVSEPEKSLLYPGPEFCHEHLASHITSICNIVSSDFTDRKHFRLTVDDCSYRVTRIQTINGDYLALRAIKPEIFPLDSTGLHQEIVDQVRSEELSRGGLIIISGRSGSGKSTSCASMIVDRLERFGGVCNTVEYPAEFMMTGLHGKGLCLQRSVDSEDEFETGVRDALRSFPSKSNNVLFLGEILDESAAVSALKSAIDGHLVFTTMHSGSIIMALERLVTLASRRVGDEEAKQILSSGLRMVVHQNLRSARGRHFLSSDILVGTMKVSKTIANCNSIKQLSTEIQSQKLKVQNNQRISSQGEQR